MTTPLPPGWQPGQPPGLPGGTPFVPWPLPEGASAPVTLANSFEGGTSGTAVSAANSAASGDAFNSVTIGAGATLAYDSTQFPGSRGGVCCQVATGASNVTVYAQWSASMGPQPQVWFRIYLYFTAFPSAIQTVWRALQGSTTCGGVQVHTTGVLQFTNATGAAIFATAATIPVGTWFRIEGYLTGSPAAGQAELRLFKTADGVGADEIKTSAATQNTLGTPDTYRFGIGVSGAGFGPYWMDDAGLSNAGYLGPSVPPPATAPVLLPPQAPAAVPGLPGLPGGTPFAPWPPPWQTAAASDVLAAAATVTAAGAAVLTEAKPVNAAVTVTAASAAAETTAKPLNAATTVTAAAAASLAVVKAGVTPAPAYPPAWLPAAPGVPAGEPFAPWPVWSGLAGIPTPQDLLNAAATVTAAGAAALTEAKPVSAAVTVTGSRAAAETTAKPVNAAVTVTAGLAAALATAKPLNAAATVVTAVMLAAAADAAPPAAAVPQYTPAWFPGAPAVPAGEAFAPWPPWAGTLPLAPAPVLVNAASALLVTAPDTSAATVTERAGVTAGARSPHTGSIYTATYQGTYPPDPAPPGPQATGTPGTGTVTEQGATKPGVSDG